VHEHVTGWILGLSAFALASCQSYEPSALDAAGHQAAWHARTLEDASLSRFLERLGGEAAGAEQEFDLADGLSLAEGQLVALVFHPRLRLARLRAGLAEESSAEAGRWEDPVFSLDVLRITESVPDRWVVTPSLGFTIPISGRLAAERAHADAVRRAALLHVSEEEWAVVHEVREAWIEWSAALLRLDETERLVAALARPVRMAGQLADRGEVPRAMASLFGLKAAQEENRARRLQAEVAAAEENLRAHVGLAPDAAVEFSPSLQAGNAQGSPARISAQNPGLARLREEYAVAEEALAHEIRKQYPDLTLGPLYESDAGQSRVGLLGGLPIPFLNGNRRAIAEARVAREIARAFVESEYETLIGRWAAALARARGLAEQRTDMNAVLIPLVDDQLSSALQLMQLGEDTGLVLFESLQAAHETKLELIETRTAEAHARAEIEFLLGPAPDTQAEETP